MLAVPFVDPDGYVAAIHTSKARMPEICRVHFGGGGGEGRGRGEEREGEGRGRGRGGEVPVFLPHLCTHSPEYLGKCDGSMAELESHS